MHTTTGVKGRISNGDSNLQTIGIQFFFFFSFLFVYLCKNIIKGVISITPLILLLTDTVLILFGGFFVVFLFYA